LNTGPPEVAAGMFTARPRRSEGWNRKLVFMDVFYMKFMVGVGPNKINQKHLVSVRWNSFFNGYLVFPYYLVDIFGHVI
jgi:hypothetical protein